MAQFKYRHRGTANDDWNEDTIEAVNVVEAQTKLDGIYGIERDTNGEQINDMIKVEIIKE